MSEVRTARLLRLGVVINTLYQGIITKEEAKELLSGPLTPGDDSTRYDDSKAVDLSKEELINLILENKLFNES